MSDKRTLLICDDETDILEVLSIALSDRYHVKTLSRIDDIEQQVLEINPDIIMMDHWIPEIGGREGILRLKQFKDTKKIPIILFTASNDVQSILKETKADGFVSKPFSVKDLKDYLGEF